MQLQAWIDRKGLNYSQVARGIDDSPRNVQRYATGKRLPRPATMKRIFDFTAGEVTPNDFYGLAGQERAA